MSADGSRLAQPLTGIKVVDFTQVMLGPCCTQILGDFGADVIKIERPKSGDLSRWSVAGEGADNPVFQSLNRNKRSIALDLRGEKGKAVVLDLVRKADVVVSNFRPGVMERMGFGYERLSKINPRIIFAQGTGFGASGPYQHKGGQDVLAQAMSGVMARKSDAHHPLSIYATALADFSAGMHLVQGILLALLQRDRTGRGQAVDVSLYDSMLSMQMQEAAMWMMRKRDLNWGAMPLSGVFETTDGALVLVGAFKENPLRDICTALGIEDLSQKEHLKDLDGQMKCRDELQTIFRQSFARNTTAYWLERLEAQDLLCAPVRSLAEALDDEQTKVNGMVVEVPGANGSAARLLAPPVHLSAGGFQVRHAPPSLGEHSRAILAELGYDEKRIAALAAEGVIP
jgi:formyl-CoA transferase